MGKDLSGSRLLPDTGLLRIEKLEQGEGRWTVEAAGPAHAACPGCQTVSAARHSRYGRTLRDLPLQGVTVMHSRCPATRVRQNRNRPSHFSKYMTSSLLTFAPNGISSPLLITESKGNNHFRFGVKSQSCKSDSDQYSTPNSTQPVPSQACTASSTPQSVTGR
jgi:hypothetical protein